MIYYEFPTFQGEDKSLQQKNSMRVVYRNFNTSTSRGVERIINTMRSSSVGFLLTRGSWIRKSPPVFRTRVTSKSQAQLWNPGVSANEITAFTDEFSKSSLPPVWRISVSTVNAVLSRTLSCPYALVAHMIIEDGRFGTSVTNKTSDSDWEPIFNNQCTEFC